MAAFYNGPHTFARQVGNMRYCVLVGVAICGEVPKVPSKVKHGARLQAPADLAASLIDRGQAEVERQTADFDLATPATLATVGC